MQPHLMMRIVRSCRLSTSYILENQQILKRKRIHQKHITAMRWVLVDIAISAVVLLAVNLLEKKQKAGARK